MREISRGSAAEKSDVTLFLLETGESAIKSISAGNGAAHITYFYLKAGKRWLLGVFRLSISPVSTTIQSEFPKVVSA